MAYRITRQADRDIIDIYLRGCREFGQAQAERYHAGLAATFDLIDRNPRLAREREQFDPPVRLHPYGAHMIVSRSTTAECLSFAFCMGGRIGNGISERAARSCLLPSDQGLGLRRLLPWRLASGL
jgi:toxin ParE1/3/4